MDESACQPGWAWGTSAASLLTSESSDRPNISGFMVSLCFNRCREHHLKAEHSQRFVHAKDLQVAPTPCYWPTARAARSTVA